MPKKDLKVAAAIFESEKCLLEKAEEKDYNIYTEYKRGFPRFRLCHVSGFHVVLFSDQSCHLDPLSKNLISRQECHESIGYSKEILDSFSAAQIAMLPFPRFTPFLVGCCRTYVETKEPTAAIAAEGLVDGMNIDEEWCKVAHLSVTTHTRDDELKFALGLVQGKSSRIADFQPNEVTCFIVDDEEAQRMKSIPGFA